MLQAPDFWQHKAGRNAAPVTRTLLTPAAWLYQAGAHARAAFTRPARPGPPVICVGNVSMGGAGKTPTVIALLELLKGRGLDVHALSRGYGGALKGPIRVDERVHTYADVGDEALLLARRAPTWVAKNKVAGAEAAAEAGADIIVLDDGLQNPTLAKDLTLVVVDAEAKFGNGRVFPAGPLREAPQNGLSRADLVILMGGEAEDEDHDWLPAADTPIVNARMSPTGPLPPGAIMAFAGIARPEKFFNALRIHGADLKATMTFADHHPFSTDDLTRLREGARRHNALLVTTEKDHVRLPADVRRLVHCWPVMAHFEEASALNRVLEQALDRAAMAR